MLPEVNTLYKLSVHLPSLDIYPDFPLKNPDTRSQIQTNKVVFVTAFQKMRTQMQTQRQVEKQKVSFNNVCCCSKIKIQATKRADINTDKTGWGEIQKTKEKY